MPPTNHFTFETTAEDVAEAFALQIRGKTVLTTGVSPGGLGAYFVETIARYQPKLLILATRDISKARETAQAISSASPGVETRLLELDLGSQAQIRKAAEEVNAYAEPIDVLVNNAGVMACPYSTTKDGLESQFGTNHIGHFLFTNLIMAKIIAAGPGARTISVSSDGHRLSPIRFHDLNFSVRWSCSPMAAFGPRSVTMRWIMPSSDVPSSMALQPKPLLTLALSRAVRLTTSGEPTVNQRQPTCCSPFPLRRN